MTFCPWYLSTNVEPDQLKPEKVPDPAADQDHYCYTSSFETALEYFRSHGIPREPKGQKRFLCKNRLRNATGYKLYKSTHRDRRFNNIEEALMHVVVHTSLSEQIYWIARRYRGHLRRKAFSKDLCTKIPPYAATMP
ncbi:hypothetical protein Rs2_00636 [Raphanus sativus]|nr:hypothetical protein Rs2_50655 [Raphanus sativus]KAJ4915086.1 hypothetical protein Rs2_00636 [Raphanus sativus]